MRRSPLAIALTLSVGAIAAAVLVAAPAQAAPGGPASEIVRLTNAERAEAGCGPLRIDPALTRSAQRHSERMADSGTMSHRGYSEGIRDAGYEGSGYGQNVAAGYTSASTVMRNWMGSTSHRRNILDCSFHAIGVGYVSAGSYWTQNFGTE